MQAQVWDLYLPFLFFFALIFLRKWLNLACGAKLGPDYILSPPRYLIGDAESISLVQLPVSGSASLGAGLPVSRELLP